ncbi:MAG TPA: J domain-containing protein [Verrucomicrobiae bacterium]|jgi:hypothetical protein|nr:J domain-containing protein [Verrucomicrobiae bacterium]
MTAIMGSVAFAFITLLIIFVIFLGGFRLELLRSRAWFNAVALAVYLFVTLISFLFLKMDAGANYSTYRGGFSQPIAPNALVGLVSLTRDVISSGARLLTGSYESAFIACRVLCLNAPRIGPILLWLWEIRRKATSDEIASNFPHLNRVQILPQLRDIPGVIWLPDPRGIFLLSEELRKSLSSVLIDREDILVEPYSYIPGTPPEPEYEMADNTEILGWYKTLGLPPYAQIQSVKRAYRQLVKTYHPDKFGIDSSSSTEERMKQINIAYERIMTFHAS